MQLESARRSRWPARWPVRRPRTRRLAAPPASPFLGSLRNFQVWSAPDFVLVEKIVTVQPIFSLQGTPFRSRRTALLARPAATRSRASPAPTTHPSAIMPPVPSLTLSTPLPPAHQRIPKSPHVSPAHILSLHSLYLFFLRALMTQSCTYLSTFRKVCRSSESMSISTSCGLLWSMARLHDSSTMPTMP